MRTVAILGSGELAATLARRLAERERARRVVLVDEEVARARGKALDIAQSGPVERFDTCVEGAPDLPSVGGCEAVAVADPGDLGDDGRPSERLVERLLSAGASGIVVASAHPCPLVEALVGRGLPRERVLGSAALAQAAALRRRLAGELEVEPREVSATVLGVPPHDLIAPQATVTVGGVPVHTLHAIALRRALAAVNARAPGPVVLAAAAARVLAALFGPRVSVLPVVVWLQGEYGHRGAALAVPGRLGAGRLDSVLEIPLEPVERVALDNTAQRRLARRR